MFRKSLLCLAQICAVWLVFGETTYRDCFEIVPGDFPHVAYSRNKAVDFAVDCIGEKGWMVTEHCLRGVATVINASKGDVVSDQLFTRSYSSVDGGPGSTFTFAFRWKCQANDTTTIYNYGWVTLGTNNGALTIVASEVADGQDEVIVGYSDKGGEGEVMARPDISLWRFKEQDVCVELDSQCIPESTEGLVVIPDRINGKPVRVIGKGAFAGCSGVTEVRVPDTVRVIDNYAFVSCTRLAAINLPKGLEKIGEYAFDGCKSLVSLDLPSDVGEVGYYAFPQGTPLVLHLPRKTAARLVRLICCYPDQPTRYYNQSLIFSEEPMEEESAEGQFAWRFIVRDGEAVLGEAKDAFPVVSTSVSGALEIPSELAGLPVTTIEGFAFEGCDGLTSVKIPGTVRKIGCNPFAGCRGICEVSIPLSVTDFVAPIFCDSQDIISATIPGSERPISDFVCCPGRLRNVTVAEGSAFVGEGQFSGCQSIQSITLPSTVRIIGRCAFNGCNELKSVVLPEGLQEIGEDAFNCCGSLKALKIPGTVAVVGARAFRNVGGLKSVSLGESVQIIGEEAFSECYELESVSFPKTLLSIGRDAFFGCKRLSVIDLPDGLQDVDDGAFDSCGVRVLKVPGSMAFVGDRAFKCMFELKTLVLEEGVCGIGEDAFAGCDEIEKIVFPSTLQYIDASAFGSCSLLRSLDLPEGLLMVEDCAFGCCRDVEEIKIPSSLFYVGKNAFVVGPQTVLRVANGDVERVSEMFADAQIAVEEGQIVGEGSLAKSELVELADQLVAETFTPAFMQEFAALPPGAEVKICIADAQPGLLYSLGASATVDGIGQAVRDAQNVEATTAGVELTVVKPEGSSCFFRMAVEQP